MTLVTFKVYVKYQHTTHVIYDYNILVMMSPSLKLPL